MVPIPASTRQRTVNMQLSTKPQNPIMQILYAMEKLQDASEQMGMTEDEIVALLASGISLGNLLDYVDVMLSHRAN